MDRGGEVSQKSIGCGIYNYNSIRIAFISIIEPYKLILLIFLFAFH